MKDDLVNDICAELKRLVPGVSDALSKIEHNLRLKYSGHAYIRSTQTPAQKLESIKNYQRQGLTILQIQQKTGFPRSTIYYLLNKGA